MADLPRASSPANTSRDDSLGLSTGIPRRDFLQGSLIWAGHSVLRGAAPLLAAAGALPGMAHEADAANAGYPPALTGLRGSNDAAYAVAHALRDNPGDLGPTDLPETYDLVVVGAGISGLAAAYFYRQAKPNARILILDNHDDFGGHARRNEFTVGGKTQLMHGGTLEIDSPRPYSAIADGLLRALGIDVPRLKRHYPSLDIFSALEKHRGVFFDQETFGRDALLAGPGRDGWTRTLATAPLTPEARHDVLRLLHERPDPLAGQTTAAKMDRLSRISYDSYLRNDLHLHPQVCAMWQSRSKGWWGVGIDAISALDAWGMGFEGFEGLGLPRHSIERMGPSPAGYTDTGGSYQLHFPDGNATVARLLVRALIPAVAPAASAAATVTQRFDYGALDLPGAPIRLRLSSTVVRVHQDEADAAAPVAVTYVTNGEARRIRAGRVVLACYNAIIPYLCPELPAPQKDALHRLVKTPLLYTSVALRDASPFLRAGALTIDAPGAYHSNVYVHPALSIGAYRSQLAAGQPVLCHMQRTPCQPGLPEKEQNRAGRQELLTTPYETIERAVRTQLARMLGPFGLDPARDILAITVNRWAHGYAPEHNPLSDPDVPPNQRAHVLGRARFGAIAIANSDAGGCAYTDVAIDQAHRAVQELLQYT
jgi:spermidine dehydrogenase